MQPQTPLSPSPHGAAKQPTHLKVIIISVITLIVAVIAIVLLIVRPGNKPANQPIARAATTIAGKPYVYACSMFTRDDVADAFKIKSKDKAYITSTDAFSTNGEPLKVLDISGASEYGSSCTYYFDVTDLTKMDEAKKVDVYAVQYKDEATAKQTYEKYKAKVSANSVLSSFPSNYVYKEVNEETGKEFLNASVLRGNIEVIMTTSTNFGLDTTPQTSAINNLYLRAFQRIDDGQAQKMPDFNGIESINGNPTGDVCSNLDTVKLSSQLESLELKPIDIFGTQNLTQITDDAQTVKSLESACSYKFRTAQDAKDPANAELAYNDRYGHVLTVSKRVFGNNQDAQQALADAKNTLQSPSKSGGSRGEYAEVAIGDGAARVINKNNNIVTYSYYILENNHFYRINVTSNTEAKKSFVSKGVSVTDDFMTTVFKLAN